MKKLFPLGYKSIILTLFFFSVCHAQIVKDISVYRGDSTRIEFKANGNITAKGITFVVKLTKSFSSPRLIQKKNAIAGGSSSEIITSYSAPHTKVTVILGPEDTQDLTGATYYYDIIAADAGALESYSTFNYGIFKVNQDVQTPFDGTNLPGSGVRVGTIAIENASSHNSVILWDTTQAYWKPLGLNDFEDLLNLSASSVGNADSLGSIPAAGYLLKSDSSIFITPYDLSQATVTLPDSIIYTSELTPYVDKSSTQTITGQKNFSGTIPIKLNSDSSLRIGGYYGGVPVGLVKYQNPNDYPFYQESIVFPPDTSKAAPWRVGHTITEWDINRVGTEWSYGIEYNPSRVGNKPWMAFAMEPEYEVEEGDPDWVLYEWWYQFDWPASNIQYTNRPFQITQLVPYSGNPDSIQAQGVLSLGQLWMGTPLSTGYMLDWQFRDNDFSYLQIADTFKILYVKNNLDWLMQATSPAGGGSNISMIKVNDNDEVEISPTAGYKIKLGNNLSGSLGWRNEGNTADITIEPDSNNVIQVSNDAGISVSNLKIRGLTTDTTGSQIGDLYVDANTGNVKYVLGENLITNGDFNEWTAGVPDNWVTDTPDTTNFYYENDNGQLHFIQSTGLASAIYQGTQSVGVTYGYSFNVTQILDTFYVFEISGNTPITQTGYYTGQSTSTEVNPLISIVGTYGHCEITIDNIKVWDLNGAKQPIYEPHQTPITINGVTIADTVFIGRMEQGAVFDSIRVFDIQDSIAIQLFYRNPTDNDLITTVDTLTSDTTIVFDTTTIPAGAKVYMYPIYVGDSEAYLRSEIYWREK